MMPVIVFHVLEMIRFRSLEFIAVLFWFDRQEMAKFTEQNPVALWCNMEERFNSNNIMCYYSEKYQQYLQELFSVSQILKPKFYLLSSTNVMFLFEKLCQCKKFLYFSFTTIVKNPYVTVITLV
jgi:hypothetical protein